MIRAPLKSTSAVIHAPVHQTLAFSSAAQVRRVMIFPHKESNTCISCPEHICVLRLLRLWLHSCESPSNSWNGITSQSSQGCSYQCCLCIFFFQTFSFLCFHLYACIQHISIQQSSSTITFCGLSSLWRVLDCLLSYCPVNRLPPDKWNVSLHLFLFLLQSLNFKLVFVFADMIPLGF